MYQSVLKRYELISPYPFFAAVKVFLITCPALPASVFSLVSPIQRWGFPVYEQASSLALRMAQEDGRWTQTWIVPETLWK